MREQRLIALLVELHRGLPRLGPGDAASTLRALALCKQLPAAPQILDLGCGSGAQTLTLAAAGDGAITAVDLVGDFLAVLEQRAQQQRLQKRIRCVQADMNALPFADTSFDLIWSEGAIYIVGFDQGLKNWRPLLQPGGYLVVSELSWFRSDPPAELTAFWGEHYPAIRTVTENITAARASGWQLAGNFHLPHSAWTRDYYEPLQQRIAPFRRRYADDRDAQAVADLSEYEMALMQRYPDFYGYEFYCLRWQAD